MCTLIISLLLVQVVSISCECEYPTFNNVSVTVIGVRGVDKIAGCLEPDGFLEKASYIQVINQSVPALYKGAVQNLPNLADVILESNGLIDLHPGAFENLPNFRLLRLKDNKIEIIKVGIFNNLTLSELNLMNNAISSIETGAFDNMLKLTIVNLDYNKISAWNSDWFLQSPQICGLSVKNNQLTRIPAKAFKNLQGLHVVNGRNVTTNIYLDENMIEIVDPRALEGLDMLGWLFLSKNKIDTLDENLLNPLKQIDWLKLSYNHLNCVPDKIFEKIPTVSHYLDGNPLSDECKEKINKKL